TRALQSHNISAGRKQSRNLVALIHSETGMCTKRMPKTLTLFLGSMSLLLLLVSHAVGNPRPGKTVSFNKGWRFHLGDVSGGQTAELSDSSWRTLDLPHDWSIEGEFSDKHPATTGGGALPGGIGWYRKSFTVSPTDKNGCVFVEFDGVYRNSEVWINGHYLGKRPYGYSSFQYELTPYLNWDRTNLIAVKVDNSQQPNSRWYSGSGIYRNVWLTTTSKVFVDHWGTYVTTPEVNAQSARVNVKTTFRNTSATRETVRLSTTIYDEIGKEVARASNDRTLLSPGSTSNAESNLSVSQPSLWSAEKPYLYKIVSQIEINGKVVDRYETLFGIRQFSFDRDRGFLLNGKQVKIRGVCDHHDLGALGAAVNTRAIERQLEMLKAMGANGIRTSHNPPAPELLDLCDKMGFIVMDEAFDIWKKKKTDFDYHLDWDEWHKRDLEDMVLRDRNHPSVFIWSI